MSADQFDAILLVAHLAVGQQQDVAAAPGARLQDVLQGCQDLRAAQVGGHGLDGRRRPVQRRLVVGDRPREQRFEARAEAHHVETVATPQAAQAEQERLAGLLDALAAHRAGTVEQEDDLASDALRHRHLGPEVQQRHVAPGGVGHQRDARPEGIGLPDFEHEVLVHGRGLGGQGDPGPRSVQVDRHGVARALDAAQRRGAGVGHVDPQPVGHAPGGDRRREVVALRRVHPGGLSGGDVARRDRGGQAEAHAVGRGVQHGGVLQGHGGLGTRGQVADAHGEDVRAVLVHQEGLVPVGDGVVVDLERLLLLHDAADDAAAVDLDHEAADGAALLEREAVHRLDGAALHVAEPLPHLDQGGGVARVDLDLDALQGHGRLVAAEHAEGLQLGLHLGHPPCRVHRLSHPRRAPGSSPDGMSRLSRSSRTIRSSLGPTGIPAPAANSSQTPSATSTRVTTWRRGAA